MLIRFTDPFPIIFILRPRACEIRVRENVRVVRVEMNSETEPVLAKSVSTIP
jgi:hypothetical protein